MHCFFLSFFFLPLSPRLANILFSSPYPVQMPFAGAAPMMPNGQTPIGSPGIPGQLEHIDGLRMGDVNGGQAQPPHGSEGPFPQ